MHVPGIILKVSRSCLRKTAISFLMTGSIIFTISSNAQNIFEEQQKKIIIKNDILSLTTWDYNYIKDKLSRSGVKTSFNKFDHAGNIIESITYKLKDTLALETFKYNEEGKRTDYLKKKGVRIAYQKSSRYDDNGHLTSESGFNGSSDFRNDYEYSADGKLSQITYMIDKNLNEKRVFTHEDIMTEITVYNADEAVVSYLSLKHDASGNVIEEIVYDRDKKPTDKKIYVYNNDNRVISEVKYRGDNFYYKLTYLYNSKGDLTNLDEENPNEGRYQKKLFSYDENGNLTEMKWRRNAKEDFSTRTYQYDKNDICEQYETYYPSTKFRVLTRLNYEYY